MLLGLATLAVVTVIAINEIRRTNTLPIPHGRNDS
jgi:hypothetical protein